MEYREQLPPIFNSIDTMPNNEIKITRLIVTASLVCTIILSGIFAARESLWTLVLLVLTAAVAGLWFGAPHLYKRKSVINCLLCIAAANIFVAVPELMLTMLDFRHESGIQFGFPTPHAFLYFEPDAQLFWKRKLTDPGINSFGLPGREAVIPKPANVYRIIFLGDSITEQGHDTRQGYPDMVEATLNIAYQGYPKKFECIRLAVSGYTSYQGRILAEKYGTQLQPDLAVVYFGWNDHWEAYGSVDSQKKIHVSNTIVDRAGRTLYHNIRLLQLCSWAAAKVTRAREVPINNVRVPVDEYERNLVTIRDLFIRNNIPVVFITAPTFYYRLGVPDHISAMHPAYRNQSLLTVHERYNDVVRTVAQGRGVYLLDLDAFFRSDSISADAIQSVFFIDGIHFYPCGLSMIAQQIVDIVMNRVLAATEGGKAAVKD